MMTLERQRPEDRHARAHRIAFETIALERKEREEKTARLRQLRLKMENKTE